VPVALAALAAAQAHLCARLMREPDKAASVSTDTLLTAPEMAALLGVKESWLRSRARAGKLPVIVLGRYRRYDANAVRAAALALEDKPWAAWFWSRRSSATGRAAAERR
jgi:Helix-turn-helix domain